MSSTQQPQRIAQTDDAQRFQVGPHAGDRLLTVNDMAALLHSTPGSIRISQHRGRLPPSQMVGGRRMWWESEVSAWIDSGRDPKPHPSD